MPDVGCAAVSVGETMIGLWVALMGNSAWSGVTAGDANGLEKCIDRYGWRFGGVKIIDPELRDYDSRKRMLTTWGKCRL